MDCIVHGVAKSRTWLSDFHFLQIKGRIFHLKGHKEGTQLFMPQNGKIGLSHIYAGPKRWMLNSKVYRKTAKTEEDTPYKCLLLFSRSVVSDSLQPRGLQHTRLPCPSLSPTVWSNSRPLSQWCHPTISSSVYPAFNLSQHQGFFQWVSSFHEAKVWELQLQHHSFQSIFRVDLL